MALSVCSKVHWPGPAEPTGPAWTGGPSGWALKPESWTMNLNLRPTRSSESELAVPAAAAVRVRLWLRAGTRESRPGPTRAVTVTGPWLVTVTVVWFRPGAARTDSDRPGLSTLGPPGVRVQQRAHSGWLSLRLSGDNKLLVSEPPAPGPGCSGPGWLIVACLPHYKEKLPPTWTPLRLAAWRPSLASSPGMTRGRPTTRLRREPPAERHGRGGVYGAGAVAAPGRNRFAPCLHCVHLSFNLVCNDFKFALSLDRVYISLCKPNKLCKLLMSKLCKLS